MSVHVSDRPLRVLALVGNPRSGSRTASVATLVADALVGGEPGTAVETVDLGLLGGEVLTGGEGVDAAVELVIAADVIVVATPVYKGTYTGVLKAFLDRVPTGALGATVAVPVTVAASPAHRLLGAIHLQPLLAELGARLPARPVTLEESELGDAAEIVERWASSERPVVVATAGAARAVREAVR